MVTQSAWFPLLSNQNVILLGVPMKHRVPSDPGLMTLGAPARSGRRGPSGGRGGLGSRAFLAVTAVGAIAALGVALPLTAMATGSTSSSVAAPKAGQGWQPDRSPTSGPSHPSVSRGHERTSPTASAVAGSSPAPAAPAPPPAATTPSTSGTAATVRVTPKTHPSAAAPATAGAQPPAAPAGATGRDLAGAAAYPAGSHLTAGAVEVAPGPGTAARLEKALATSPLVTMPPGEYVFERAPIIPDNARIVGAGKALTKWFHAFTGDFAVLPESATLESLSIQGQGAQFGGRGLVLTGNAGRQVLDDVAVLGFDGYCIDFETIDAGSQFRAARLDVARVNADPTGDRYAVHMADGFQNSAVPRSFYQVETQGAPFAYLGGSNDVYITASTIGGMHFTENTRGFHLGESRWLNQPAVEIHGHGVTVTGVGIRPAVTVMPGADDVHFDGSYFNAGAVDRSGASNNTGLPRA